MYNVQSDIAETQFILIFGQVTQSVLPECHKVLYSIIHRNTLAPIFLSIYRIFLSHYSLHDSYDTSSDTSTFVVRIIAPTIFDSSQNYADQGLKIAR